MQMDVNISVDLRESIEQLTQGIPVPDIKRTVRSISSRYKDESGQGKRLIATDPDARVYSAFRFPATYGAVTDALSYVTEFFDDDIKSMTDIGAGSGAATWSSSRFWDMEKMLLLEREEGMRNVGSLLMKDTYLEELVTWQSFDLIRDAIPAKSDLVISSYVLNELSDTDLIPSVRKMWDAADKLMVIVEPGTPEGFKVIKKIRAELLLLGGHIVAPCTHEGPCQLADDDWCHFTCRIMRSKLHKFIKDAEVPYEDEKYCFIACSREPADRSSLRVLRHPRIDKGRIGIRACTPEGIEDITYRKSDGLFKKAKKCKQGDSLE